MLATQGNRSSKTCYKCKASREYTSNWSTRQLFKREKAQYLRQISLVSRCKAQTKSSEFTQNRAMQTYTKGSRLFGSGWCFMPLPSKPFEKIEKTCNNYKLAPIMPRSINVSRSQLPWLFVWLTEGSATHCCYYCYYYYHCFYYYYYHYQQQQPTHITTALVRRTI